MIDLKRILFPTDFSECGRAAEKYAWALSERFGAELHVLHVLADIMMTIPEPGSAMAVPQNFLGEMKQEAERALDKILPQATKAGLRVVRATRMGNAYVEIVKYAEEKGIDLIVVGTHGRSALMHMLLGSVAEKVVRHSACPVLTVRPAGHQFVTP
jgi:universal stress protein A